MPRPRQMTEKMTRRNLWLPDALWRAAEKYAAKIGAIEGKPLPVAEVIRRILERELRKP
jgi:hypothetical protein